MKINSIFFVISFLLSSSLFAVTTQEAFREFYDYEKIDFNHCGVNTQLFIKYLKEQKVNYRDGYVVSVHEPIGRLNHFDSRWGRLSRYENGEEYFRSNWYFHVFAVIDGIAYDFSQAGGKTQPLNEYLTTSYIPKYKTENIFFLGQFDRNKALKNYLNTEMRIYKLDDYEQAFGPAIYNGSFVELFGAQTPAVSTKALDNLPIDRTFSSIKFDSKSVTITNPQFVVNGQKVGLLAYEKKICRAYGFMGAMPNKTVLAITDNEPALNLNTSLVSDDPMDIKNVNLTLSVNMKKTSGNIKKNYYHHAQAVVCSSFNSLFRH